MADALPTPEEIAQRAFDLLWTQVSDPAVRKEALKLFLVGLVERQRGPMLTARVKFIVDALAVGIVKAGEREWRELLARAAGIVVAAPPPPFQTKQPSPFDDPLVETLLGKLRRPR